MPLRRTVAAATLTLAAVALASASRAAAAQVATARLAPARAQVLSIQPVSSIIGLYAAEYERRISETTTFGIGATAWLDEYDDGDYYDGSRGDRDRYLSAELKFRYYPGAEPLRGFSFGFTGGVASLTNEVYVGSATFERRTTTAGKIGFELDYNWLLGRDERFAVSLGAGAKRLIMREDEFFDSDFLVARAYPTARLSVGIAF
ncbi:MAG TPA: hypothetical protein VKA84_12275 [Gemmatimonadaceae bacterium]|nr:hypothetical protein [Gemmatimonadaceae bacterium]